MRHLQDEQSQLDQDLEENQSERNQKYRELRSREANMDSFLEKFEENQANELERLSELEQQIQAITESMSANLQHVGHMPTTQGFSVMKDDLAFKEGEMEKSKNTLTGVNQEHQQLKMNLEKASSKLMSEGKN